MRRLDPKHFPDVEHLADDADPRWREVYRQAPTVHGHPGIVVGLIAPQPMNDAPTEHGQRVVEAIFNECDLTFRP